MTCNIHRQSPVKSPDIKKHYSSNGHVFTKSSSLHRCNLFREDLYDNGTRTVYTCYIIVTCKYFPQVIKQNIIQDMN